MNNLNKTLKQQGVTQSELARQLKVTRQCVNNWTRGINLPNMKLIKLVSIYLKVPIDKLFFEE
jgi:DNA-binding XRE family transcriptional regulator